MFTIKSSPNGSYIWKYGRSEGRWLVCGLNLEMARAYKTREAAESWLPSIRKTYPKAVVVEVE